MEKELERKDDGVEYYPIQSKHGTKKFPTTRADEYNVTVVSGIRDLDYWAIDKNAQFPKQHLAEIGVPIALVITERNESTKKDEIVAKALGLGFTGGYNIDKEITNGEIVISRIINKDGSIRELSDADKFKYTIETREKTVGDGRNQRNELYSVLNDIDAKHLVIKVMGDKNALINSPLLDTKDKKSYRFPMEDISPSENQTPYPLRVPNNKTESSLVP